MNKVRAAHVDGTICTSTNTLDVLGRTMQHAAREEAAAHAWRMLEEEGKRRCVRVSSKSRDCHLIYLDCALQYRSTLLTRERYLSVISRTLVSVAHFISNKASVRVPLRLQTEELPKNRIRRLHIIRQPELQYIRDTRYGRDEGASAIEARV